MEFDLYDLSYGGSPPLVHIVTAPVSPYSLIINCVDLYSALGDRDSIISLKVKAYTLVNYR